MICHDLPLKWHLQIVLHHQNPPKLHARAKLRRLGRLVFWDASASEESCQLGVENIMETEPVRKTHEKKRKPLKHILETIFKHFVSISKYTLNIHKQKKIDKNFNNISRF